MKENSHLRFHLRSFVGGRNVDDESIVVQGIRRIKKNTQIGNLSSTGWAAREFDWRTLSQPQSKRQDFPFWSPDFESRLLDRTHTDHPLQIDPLLSLERMLTDSFSRQRFTFLEF